MFYVYHRPNPGASQFAANGVEGGAKGHLRELNWNFPIQARRDQIRL
jgi:hypothetical protein